MIVYGTINDDVTMMVGGDRTMWVILRFIVIIVFLVVLPVRRKGGALVKEVPKSEPEPGAPLVLAKKEIAAG